MGNVGARMKKVAAVSRALFKVGTVAGATIAGFAVVVGRTAVKAAAEAERANMMLTAQLANVKTASKSGAKELIQYADRLQTLTGYSDEEIKSAMAMLATFQLNEKQIKQVILRVLDMAAATEKLSGAEADLQQIAIAVGKGVTGQVGVLSRYGVVISDSVKKSKDFNAILVELDKNFKGSAKTLRDTYIGQVRALKNALDDLKEIMGNKLLPIVREWTVKMTEWAQSDEAEKWAEDVAEAIKGIGHAAIWTGKRLDDLRYLASKPSFPVTETKYGKMYDWMYEYAEKQFPEIAKYAEKNARKQMSFLQKALTLYYRPEVVVKALPERFKVAAYKAWVQSLSAPIVADWLKEAGKRLPDLLGALPFLTMPLTPLPWSAGQRREAELAAQGKPTGLGDQRGRLAERGRARFVGLEELHREIQVAVAGPSAEIGYQKRIAKATEDGTASSKRVEKKLEGVEKAITKTTTSVAVYGP